MAIITMNGKRYRTHAEVLNKLFGKHYVSFQRAARKLDNDYCVWFPVVSRTDSKGSSEAKAAGNGWINLLVNNDNEIFQYWPDPKFAPDQERSPEKRITFAKFTSGSAYWYEFIGVYEIDKSLTAHDHTVYKRIAKQYHTDVKELNEIIQREPSISTHDDGLLDKEEELSNCSSLESAIRAIHARTFRHGLYRHYTSLSALIGMINSGSIWLTLGKSAKLDDQQERDKFGNEEVWSRTYMACFVHDEEESAAMWGLYCPRDEKAVCLEFSADAMKHWSQTLNGMVNSDAKVVVNPQNGRGDMLRNKQHIRYANIIDIVYANVAKVGYSDRVRENFVSCDGAKSLRIDSLKKDAKKQM